MQDVGLEDFEGGKARPYKALTLDIERYQRMLDHPDLDADARDDILKALWSIICFFVEAGYQVQPEESCGQDAERAALSAVARADLLESDQASIANSFDIPAAKAVNKEEP